MTDLSTVFRAVSLPIEVNFVMFAVRVRVKGSVRVVWPTPGAQYQRLLNINSSKTNVIRWQNIKTMAGPKC